jgi:DNA-binding FadR family transcriptional regulator
MRRAASFVNSLAARSSAALLLEIDVGERLPVVVPHDKTGSLLSTDQGARKRREHAAFHAALVSASGSHTLISIRGRLFEQAERYVSLSIISKAPLRDDVGEHKQLMRAALNRDVEKTVELNRLHISRTLEKVAASLAANRSAENGVTALKRKSFK